MKGFSIILPVLNEAGHIESLVKDIFRIFKKKKTKFEIIIVDDGSTDGTRFKIKKLLKRNSFIKKIFINNVKKLPNAINQGIYKSKFDYIIWMDADYSHPPAELKKIFKEINNKKNQVIIFSRFLKKSTRHYLTHQTNFLPIEYFSNFLNFLFSLFKFDDVTDFTSGFICIKKKLLPMPLKGYYGDYFINLVFNLKKNKIKITELPFKELPRKSGFSKTHSSKIGFIIKSSFYAWCFFKNFALFLFSKKRF